MNARRHFCCLLRVCYQQIVVAMLCLYVPAEQSWGDEPRSDAGPPNLRVSRDFPSGSGEVIEIDQQQRRIRLKPSTFTQQGWISWWYFRVEGIQPGEMITVEVGPAPWATPVQAAFSTDNRHWKQTAPGKRQGGWIVYRQRIDTTRAWFAWGPPFTAADAAALVERAAQSNSAATAFELCQTRRGQSVPALRIDDAEARPRYGIWVQARQHAWEAGSSWVCRGFVEWLMSADERAQNLREMAVITVVPVMDIDSVLSGAGGKDQAPHDHNRDWGESPHWPAVAAAMRELRRLDEQEQLDLFVDLHNPGASTTRPFFYITPRSLQSALRERNLDRFLAATQMEMTGPLKFVGETRSSGPDYDRQWERISKNWVSRNTREHVVALTLETAWNTEHSHVAGYQAVGRQLGRAIERYLRLQPRAGGPQEKEPGQQ